MNISLLKKHQLSLLFSLYLSFFPYLGGADYTFNCVMLEANPKTNLILFFFCQSLICLGFNKKVVTFADPICGSHMVCGYVTRKCQAPAASNSAQFFSCTQNYISNPYLFAGPLPSRPFYQGIACRPLAGTSTRPRYGLLLTISLQGTSCLWDPKNEYLTNPVLFQGESFFLKKKLLPSKCFWQLWLHFFFSWPMLCLKTWKAYPPLNFLLVSTVQLPKAMIERK